MDDKELFEKYRARISKFGKLKAFLVALIFGFSVVGIAAIITWFCNLTLMSVLIISIGSGALVTAILTPIMYFKRFYPTPQKIACLLDKLGLEERIVTMYDFRNDKSSVAALQREDAKARLSGVSEKRFIFKLSLKMVVLLACSILFAASFTTVSALAAEGMIEKGNEIIDSSAEDDKKGEDGKEDEEDVYFLVKYVVVLGEGHIEGEAEQKVKKGGNTKQVTAVPAEGFMFYAWTDETYQKVLGVDQVRIEFKVKSDMTICALFIPSPQQEEGEDQKESGGNKPGQNEAGGGGDDEQKPGGNNGNAGGSGNGSDGAGSGSSGEQMGGSGDVVENGSSSPAGQREDNSVIDGKQNYKDSFDREQNDKELSEDDTLPEELKDILGDYYEALDT